MQIIPGIRPRDRVLALNTGERLTHDQLTSSFLASGSFANRPAVEAELHAVFDVLAAVAERLMQPERK